MVDTPIKITADWIISDILSEFPNHTEELREELLAFGIHCVGCVASSFETLEEGVLGHGFSQENLDELLNSINDIISSGDDCPLFISPLVRKVLDETFSTKKKTPWLRLSCEVDEEGVVKKMNFVASPFQGDATFPFENGGIAIEPTCIPMFEKTSLEYDSDSKTFFFADL